MTNNFNPIEAFGIGVFETLPFLDGKIPFLGQHLERMRKGLIFLNSYSSEFKKEEVIETIQSLNLQGNKVIRIIARYNCEPEISISDSYPYAYKDYNVGFSLCIAAATRKNESSPINSIKSLNYLENFLARQKAKSLGFNDAVFLNSQGKVAETSTANIFAFKNKELFTPSINQGLLPGIIRSQVIKYALQNNITVKEQPMGVDQLTTSDYVFVTNSLLCIMPVRKINDQHLNISNQFAKDFFENFFLTNEYSGLR